MASMQMCRPTCEVSCYETEKQQFSSSASQGCYSSEYKHQETKSSSYSMSHDQNHNIGSLFHKHPSHNQGAHGCYSSEHKHHEQSSAGCTNAQAGHHEPNSAGCTKAQAGHHEPNSAGCTKAQAGHLEPNSAGCTKAQAGHHNMGLMGNLYKHPNQNHGAQGCYSTEHKQKEHNKLGHSENQGGHHGFTEKIAGFFSSKGSNPTHGHKPTQHGCGSYQGSYGCTEKTDERMSYKAGHMEAKVHITKKSSYKGKCEDSESEDKGCNTRC